MRHLAMTGMVTASMIWWISSGSDMRATPPSRRMSAGTRSSAMTATAPASSAMRACSAEVTSMMTPPFSISARPRLIRSVPCSTMWTPRVGTARSPILPPGTSSQSTGGPQTDRLAPMKPMKESAGPLFGVTPGHNLGMDLVRVTEAGALAAARWLGRGDKDGADGAAVDAMRTMLATISMDGLVVIGEGEKDEAPMLYNGERVGTGATPLVDAPVDPVDGTTLTAKGQPSALVLLAVADRGAMFDPGPCFYMEKICTGPDAADVIDIEVPIGDNLKRIARAKREDI